MMSYCVCLSMRQSLADPLPLIVHCAEEHNMLCIAASLSSLLAVVIEPFFLWPRWQATWMSHWQLAMSNHWLTPLWSRLAFQVHQFSIQPTNQLPLLHTGKSRVLSQNSNTIQPTICIHTYLLRTYICAWYCTTSLTVFSVLLPEG